MLCQLYLSETGGKSVTLQGEVQGQIQVSWALSLYSLVAEGLFTEARALGNALLCLLPGRGKGLPGVPGAEASPTAWSIHLWGGR